MLKRIRYIILSAIVLFSASRVAAQIAMPDTVCAGATKTYSVNTVNPPVGSTYTWTINGVTQGATTNAITITWNVSPGTYTLTVQETSSGGCPGDIQSGDVVVLPVITPTFTAIGPLCQNSTAPTLPTTSTNAITGTWSPATINTATVGTTTYTFTPAAGQCAVVVTMEIGRASCRERVLASV